jgi:hypothetical protein
MTRRPNLSSALDVTSPEIAVAVREASRALRSAGVRHALCGGIAVGAYGRPRATKDVDFLVGEEAFVKHGLLVTMNPAVPTKVGTVPVDSVPLEPHLRALEPILDAPAESEGVPVVPPEALIAMKLVAGRLQDQADIASLLENGAVDPQECRAWLVARGFAVEMYDELVRKVQGTGHRAQGTGHGEGD